MKNVCKPYRPDEGNEEEEDLEADIDKERRLVQHHISSREFQRRMSAVSEHRNPTTSQPTTP